MSQKAFVNASGNNILDITGTLRMRNSGATLNAAVPVKFFDNNNINSVDIKAPPVLDVSNTVYKLPTNYPATAGLSLLSDATGNMSWGNPIGSLACLDVSNVDISNQVVDPYTNSSQVLKAIGTCVEYTAFHDISNGTICVTEVSNNRVYAANPQTVLTNLEYERLIGVAIEDASAGSIIKILEEGYCSVRVDPYDDGTSGGPPGSVPIIILDQNNSGNTFAADPSGIYFRDDGGILGDYSNSQTRNITFDAGPGNTAYILLETGVLATEWEFEFGIGGGLPTSTMYDRLGFQTSTDGINYTNASIEGFCSSSSSSPPWNSTQDTNTNGYIFPMDFSGNVTYNPAAGNPPPGASGVPVTFGPLPAQLPPAGSQTRFLRFYFRADGSGQFSGWNLLVKGTSSVPTPAGPTYPINSLLYLSDINLERATNILGGNIPIGYTVSENLGNTINQYVFARIHDR